MRARRFMGTLLGLSVVGALFAPMGGAQAAGERRVSAWLPYWDNRALDDFIANADLYDELLPFWYEMRSSTSIFSYSGAGSQSVITAARDAGVALLPTITNHFDADRLQTMLATDSNLNAHVATLTELAQPYDGLDVDYESGYATDRSRFTIFTQRLAASLHAAGKTLSMTVHPKTSEPGTWDGPKSQNWAAIGAVADRVRIMAYDYSWSGSTAGGVAPLSWVRNVTAFAVTQIPARKVKLGMPLYGYDWVGSNGAGVTWETANAIRVAKSASVRRSSDGSEPWFVYTASGLSHTVWYSDRQSTAAKLALVDTYGISGLTFWRLGGEDPTVWDAVRNWSGLSSAPTGDTTPPSTVTGLIVKGYWRSSSLWWRASTDESAVRYQVWRSATSGGTLWKRATVDVTGYNDRDVKPGRTYWYAIRPIDAVGNVGKMSARVSS